MIISSTSETEKPICSLVTTNATDAAIRRGDEIYAIHNNVNDVSVLEFAKVERVPLEAHTPSRTYDGRRIRRYVADLLRYSALYNRATDALLDVRPVSRHYALILHDSLSRTSCAAGGISAADDHVTVTVESMAAGRGFIALWFSMISMLRPGPDRQA